MLADAAQGGALEREVEALDEERGAVEEELHRLAGRREWARCAALKARLGEVERKLEQAEERLCQSAV